MAVILLNCAPQTLSIEQAHSIRSIALADPDNPKQYALRQGDVSSAIALGAAAGPGAAASALGGSLSGPGQGGTLTEALAAQRLKLGDELAAALRSELSRQGYEMLPAQIPRRNPAALLDSYNNANAQTDALLDVAIEPVHTNAASGAKSGHR